MSWEDYRHRSRVMDAVLDDVAASRSGQLPARWRPEIDAAFGGEAGFAQALYRRWFAALTVRLDPVLEARAAGRPAWAGRPGSTGRSGPVGLPAAAARAARQLARERPALFALLAAYSGHPALEAARQRERHDLAWAPGAQLAALTPLLDDLLPPVIGVPS